MTHIRQELDDDLYKQIKKKAIDLEYDIKELIPILLFLCMSSVLFFISALTALIIIGWAHISSALPTSRMPTSWA